MKALISIFLVLTAIWVFLQIAGVYDRTAKPHAAEESAARAATPSASSGGVPGDELPGLPPQFEASLTQARSGGVEELGKWLKQWGKQVRDPRLASIELDYIVMLNLRNHKAARERFLEVATRTQPGSPVFERIRKLAPAYDQ